MPVAIQMSLFPQVVASANLMVVASPRGTFYRIWIEEHCGAYAVIKESGAKGRVLDRREWSAYNMDQAQKMFDLRVKNKTNPNRKSPRIYQKAELSVL